MVIIYLTGRQNLPDFYIAEYSGQHMVLEGEEVPNMLLSQFSISRKITLGIRKLVMEVAKNH